MRLWKAKVHSRGVRSIILILYKIELYIHVVDCHDRLAHPFVDSLHFAATWDRPGDLASQLVLFLGTRSLIWST